MLEFNLPQQAPLKVLCLGAHCDDIEIGCGATLLHLARTRALTLACVMLSGDAQREAEARASIASLLPEVADKRIDVAHFRNSYFPYHGEAIKDYLSEARRGYQPDLIFTHYRHDLHQDHRLVAELTRNLYRDHAILEYEIPKYDGDLGQPNVYVTVDPDSRRRKLGCLLEHYPSQASHPWFSAETFDALMRLRGIEGNSPSGYAEAFYASKIRLQ